MFSTVAVAPVFAFTPRSYQSAVPVGPVNTAWTLNGILSATVAAKKFGAAETAVPVGPVCPNAGAGPVPK
jgi:hypothetical protein